MNKKLTLTILFLFTTILAFCINGWADADYIEGKWITEDGKEIWIWEKVNENDGILTIINKETGEEEYYGWKYVSGFEAFQIQFSHNRWSFYTASIWSDGSIELYAEQNANVDWHLRRVENE